MFDAMPGVIPRVLSLRFLVRIQHHVDCQVAVGVNGDLEPSLVHLHNGGLGLLRRHGEDAVIV